MNFILFKNKKAEEIFQLVREDIKEELKDPDSANFRNEKIIRKENRLYVCGEVNAKNSYGGYVGFMPYFSAVITHTYVMTEDEGFISDFIIPYFCIQ